MKRGKKGSRGIKKNINGREEERTNKEREKEGKVKRCTREKKDR